MTRPPALHSASQAGTEKDAKALVFPVMKMRSKRNLGSAAAGLAGE